MRLVVTTFSILIIGSFAGTALADPPGLITRPDDRAGVRGANAPLPTTAPAAVRPDDRAGIRGVGTDLSQGTGPVRPDDRAGVRGVGAPEIVSTTPSIASASSFDWGDAGIGAASTLALILAGGVLFLVGVRRRGHARGSSPAPALHA